MIINYPVYCKKISFAITKQYDTIVVESLNIKGMMQNRKLYVSWYKFMEMLEYKTKWYGKNLIKVDRFYASSKTCNVGPAYIINKEMAVGKCK